MASFENEGEHFVVRLPPDEGVTELSLKAWRQYQEELGHVKRIIIKQGGIRELPVSEHLLATMVLLGENGTGLALTGANCGYGGEGPHGSETILKDLEVPEHNRKALFRLREVTYAWNPSVQAWEVWGS